MLIKFSGDAHDHLISLLTTYQRGDEFYLIFPWAGCDLQSFWRDMSPEPLIDHGRVRWAAQQCHGIATGLAEIHRHQTLLLSPLAKPMPTQLFGRHGDIKPQNVLWFDTSCTTDSAKGVLKITDFGLAEFKTKRDEIYRTSSHVSTTLAYRPPECATIHGRVGQSHDIWSLGCLYLEMVAWLLGGWALVQELESLRAAETNPYYSSSTEGSFFILSSMIKGKATFIVKPAVTKVSQAPPPDGGLHG